MYFIDINTPYEVLLTLIHHNLRNWGGRYNPIVPVNNGVIVDGYIDAIKHFDPDYIFYSNAVNPEEIKKLRFFNPCGYFNLDENPIRQDILGVDALYLLSQFDQKSNVLMPEALFKTGSPLLNFYRTNFGITTNGIVSDYEITKNYNQIIISPGNFSTLNEIIHTNKPINQAHLSGRNLNTRILRNLTHAQYNSFELIIDGDKNSIADLLYFWNRHLFQCHNLVYITTDELTLLQGDKYFGGILYDMSSEPIIDVVSNSLRKEEVEEIINKSLSKISFHRQFRYKSIDKFPFEVLDANGLYEREFGESASIQTLLSESGLLFLPDLSFTSQVGFYPQKWAVDTQIKEITDLGNKFLRFPLTTDTGYILREVSGRINRYRDISFFIHNQVNASGAVDIQIPLLINLFRQLFCHPLIHGDRKDTKYVDIGLHDSSNKLNAFIKTFGGSLSTIEEYFTDKFWVDVFEERCKSEKAAGDSITFHELLSECKDIFAKAGHKIKKRKDPDSNEEVIAISSKVFQEAMKNVRRFLSGLNTMQHQKKMPPGVMKLLQKNLSIIRRYETNSQKHLTSELFQHQNKEATFRNEENLALGLQVMLTSLCKLGVFLQGFKLKCPRCASNFWYPMKEVNEHVNCRGCLENFTLPVESKISYKLNDLIKNNIFQSKTQRDGNLAVLRTLISLGNRTSQAFEYSPQLNLFDDQRSAKPCDEIDIATIADGKLTIGEAKHNSSEFKQNSNKALNSLIEVSKAIRPDKVIISCYEDEHSRLENAKKYLDHHFKHWDYAPEVEALPLSKPDYFNLAGSKYFYY